MKAHPATARRALLTITRPVLPLIGRLQWPLPRLLTKADAASFMYTVPLAGTILLSRKRAQATNLVIPGEWKHLAIYVGGGQIIEAVWPKVRKIGVEEWFCHQDYAVAKVPIFAPPRGGFTIESAMAVAAKFALSLEGKDYDLFLEFRQTRAANKAFYCSEVGWWCYEQPYIAAGSQSPFTPRMTMGAATIPPDDYDLAVDKWKTTWSRARRR